MVRTLFYHTDKIKMIVLEVFLKRVKRVLEADKRVGKKKQLQMSSFSVGVRLPVLSRNVALRVDCPKGGHPITCLPLFSR